MIVSPRRACAVRIFLTLLVGACMACASAPPLSRRPDPRDAPQPPAAESVPSAKLWSNAQAVFETRCVVCHGCYDAPCQLKLDSLPGAERGAIPERVYDASRLTAAQPTRMFIDARLVSEWRQKGFHSVLPDATQTDPKRAVMMRMLELKRAHPLTSDTDLTQAFSLGLDREQTCPKADTFDAYASEHPLWGMPYALPALSDTEHEALVAWLNAGAPQPEPPQPSAALQREATSWEDFLNEPSLKRQLAARYIYEHLFLASLSFPEIDRDSLFRLVRSRTPSGFPADEIPTRRPFDDPELPQVYYRLVRSDGARLAKTLMPYALGPARLARYRELFVTPDYTVERLPGYDAEKSANPLSAFAALPVSSRYQFMLDEAQYTLMGFIKGPVCRGQVALNVIQERFWITFVDPASNLSEKEAQLLQSVVHDLDLPADAGSNAWLTRWFEYADQHAKYVVQKNKVFADVARSPRGLGMDLVWNGGGSNRNAGLTVFRHFDSATVVQGLVGGPPKTAWLIDYPMLERIHYLLVAGFDVFGNVGHQLLTRMYMDFLRMEGEANFLALLPRARRIALAHAWYRGVSKSAQKKLDLELAGYAADPRIVYRDPKPELELYTRLSQLLAAARSREYELSPDEPLEKLQATPGLAAALMPELSFIAVRSLDAETQYFSVMRDSAHTNVAELFNEDDRRVPADDLLRVVPGFLGAYPNAIFSVAADQRDAFTQAVAALSDEASYQALRKRFGVARNSPDFWRISDAMQAATLRSGAHDAGLFDYNRLQPD